MAADHLAMAHLDQLLEHMQQALKDQDWELISRLKPEIKPAIEPLLEALKQGQLPAETVRSQRRRRAGGLCGHLARRRCQRRSHDQGLVQMVSLYPRVVHWRP